MSTSFSYLGDAKATVSPAPVWVKGRPLSPWQGLLSWCAPNTSQPILGYTLKGDIKRERNNTHDVVIWWVDHLTPGKTYTGTVQARYEEGLSDPVNYEFTPPYSG